MIRSAASAAILMAGALLSGCATAGDLSDVFGRASKQPPARADGPPASYPEQHWISPNGCSYSRAKAPGYAPTWHLILNGAHVGLTDAHRGCAVMLKSS